MTKLNIPAEKPQHYEMTNIVCIMRQNYSPITWLTLKACYDKRTKLHALTYITLKILGYLKNKIQLH